ncbi:unnamed protein product, partial [marine sediment metagenome]
MESKGWRPNALHIGDSYYALNRLDPMGQLLAMYATGFEFSKEATAKSGGNAALAVMASVLSTADVLKERSFLSGIAQFLSAVDMGAAGTKQFGNLLASSAASFIVPGLARDFRMAADPASRSLVVDYGSNRGLGAGLWDRFTNVIKNAYPGASQGLPPRLDWKGDTITNEGGTFWRGLMPINVGTVRGDDPTSWMLVNGIAPRKPSHKMVMPETQGRVLFNFLDLEPEGHLYAAYQQQV